MVGSSEGAATPRFVELARSSETLLPQLATFLSISFALIASFLLVIVLVHYRTAQCRGAGNHRRLIADQSGAALSVDFILVAVPAIVFIALILQMTWLMRETVIVHYAAYDAARTAKAHRCPLIPAGLNAGALAQQQILCSRQLDEELQAARYALISASPPWDIPCLSSCDVPETVLRTIAQHSGVPQRANALLRQAQYAYDEPNVSLEVTIDHALLAMAGQAAFEPGVRPAVRSELRYRHYIMRWVGRLIGTERPDGLYYHEARAVVRLL